MSNNDPIEQFRQAMRAAGLSYTGDINCSETIQRFGLSEDKGKKPCWYKFVIKLNDFAYGLFGCFKRGIKETWSSKSDQALPKKYQTQLDQDWKQLQQAERLARQQAQAKRANVAQQQWDSATVAKLDHPYLKRKRVLSYDLRTCVVFNDKQDDWLLVPVRDLDDNIISLQAIAPDGKKAFLAGASSKGAYVLGDLHQASDAYLVSGRKPELSLFL